MTAEAVVPARWVELLSLDHAFTLLELERLPDYGITGATLWTSFEYRIRAELDNYTYTLPVTYRRHADLNALRDQDRIRAGAAFLREFARRAHRLGLTVMHGYHLCNFVGRRFELTGQLRGRNPSTGLEEKRPAWFNEHGEVDFSKPDFYEFMAAEVDDFFEQFPQVDGLFCWNCECSTFTPSRLSRQSVSKAEIARRAVRAVYDVCRRRGKTMTHDIHAAGADAELSRAIIAAAGECPEVILGADATYSDWHLHLPTTPWVPEMRRHNRAYVGFDASGEFFGQGRTVGGWPRWIGRHFAALKEHGLAAVTIRCDTLAPDNSCLLAPLLELNLRLVARLARDGEADLDALFAEWWRRHFSGELPDGMKDVVLSFEEYLEKALYINGTNITEYNPDHGFPRKAVDVAPGYPCWHAEQFTKPGTPIAESMCRMIPTWGHRSRPVQELRREKLDAIAICNRAMARLPTLKMDGDDRAFFLARVHQARDVAEAFLLTIDLVYPLYQLLGEPYDRGMADPKAALRKQVQVFLAHAAAMEQRWGPEFYRRFTPKMREFAADIPPALYA